MRRSHLPAICAPVLLLCWGCGNGRPPTYEVRGQVFANDRPAAHALVTFHPIDDNMPEAVHPTATVDDSGNFTLTSFTAGDGAPAGEYRVTVVRYLAVKSRPGAEDYDTRNFLPDRYAKLETSELRATVKKGKNELEPFKLSVR
jgi:hypothetical protein